MRAACMVALVMAVAPDSSVARPTIQVPGVATAPIELADLIALSLPSSDEHPLGWDYMATAPVVWRRAGYERDSLGNTVRIGLARVRIGGRLARKLGRQTSEIAWTIILQGSPNPQRGVIAVDIAPGSADQPCLGEVADCLFRPEDVFSATTLQHRRICFVGAEEAYQSVYTVTAPGRSPGFVVFTRNFGPDGGTVRVDVSWSGSAPGCKDPAG